MTRRSPSLPLVIAALLAACGGSGTKKMMGADGGADTNDGGDAAPTTCGDGGTGQLVLAVTGLPTDVTPMVEITRGSLPAPMMLTVGTPVTLDARGGYEIDTRRVKAAPTAPSVVGKAFQVLSSSFDGCVRGGATTTVTLTYAQEPGSEHLWITASNPPTADDVLAGFLGMDLAATAAKNPAVWKSKNFTGFGGAGAFDALGNFWVPGGDRVNMYAASALAMPGDLAPPVVLTQPATASANFAAFDLSGNLWVARGAPGTENSIVRYAPQDQSTSGAPTPAVTLTSVDLMNPSGLAFDSFGDLWVASEANDEVLMFLPAHLGASYAGAADVVLTADDGVGATPSPYTSPIQLAFDKAGDLWVGYIGDVVTFTRAQQLASSHVTAPRALAGVAARAGAFAFDESGGLWLDGPAVGQFQRFPAAALMTGGAVTPDIVITSSELGGAESLVFDPAPTWSPIQDTL
jgi:hypothetical protein